MCGFNEQCNEKSKMSFLLWNKTATIEIFANLQLLLWVEIDTLASIVYKKNLSSNCLFIHW